MSMAYAIDMDLGTTLAGVIGMGMTNGQHVGIALVWDRDKKLGQGQ